MYCSQLHNVYILFVSTRHQTFCTCIKDTPKKVAFPKVNHTYINIKKEFKFQITYITKVYYKDFMWRQNIHRNRLSCWEVNCSLPGKFDDVLTGCIVCNLIILVKSFVHHLSLSNKTPVISFIQEPFKFYLMITNSTKTRGPSNNTNIVLRED